MTDMEQALSLFQGGEYSCVLCMGGITHTSKNNGISPLVDFLTAGIDLSGFSAADKIVGKAAAMLFVFAGIKEGYASIISRQAIEVLEKYNVKYSYGTLAEVITNRTGTGLCPMEQAVRDIDDPTMALDAVKRALNELSNR